jgi:hypothetical protein
MNNDFSERFTTAMEILASLAYQFGPFFFTILFVLVITRSAKKWYSDVDARKNPDEKLAYEKYFRASWVFGMFLCLISVSWWIRSQWEGHHAFAGTIVALNPNQSLSSISSNQNFYSRLWAHQDSPVDALRDYWFVVISDHPVHRGEVFRLNYWDVAGPGEVGKLPPPPTATIDVEVTDPDQFPQKYQLIKTGQNIRAVPFN